MTKAQLMKKLSRLESEQDYLQAELINLDQLLLEMGFEEGTESLKRAAQEVLEEGFIDF